MTWSEPAKADLRAIHDFIAASSPYYGKKVVQDIVAKADTLASMPFMGKVVTELNDESVRELSSYSYRVLYEVRDQDVFIPAVIHFRRNLQDDLIER